MKVLKNSLRLEFSKVLENTYYILVISFKLFTLHITFIYIVKIYYTKVFFIFSITGVRTLFIIIIIILIVFSGWERPIIRICNLVI